MKSGLCNVLKHINMFLYHKKIYEYLELKMCLGGFTLWVLRTVNGLI
jgi:hypothetical protein